MWKWQPEQIKGTFSGRRIHSWQSLGSKLHMFCSLVIQYNIGEKPENIWFWNSIVKMILKVKYLNPCFCVCVNSKLNRQWDKKDLLLKVLTLYLDKFVQVNGGNLNVDQNTCNCFYSLIHSFCSCHLLLRLYSGKPTTT